MFFKPKEHEPSHIHANIDKLQIMWDTQIIEKLKPLEQIMIPRIKSVNTKGNYKLDVFFDDGKHVLYDVSDDIKNIPDFADLKTQYALFNNFTLDQSRTCITWSDRIDLSSDSIYQYGVEIN